MATDKWDRGGRSHSTLRVNSREADHPHMTHQAIERIRTRAESERGDSDFTYFYCLLLEGEAIVKTIVLGLIAGIVDDPDRNRYRLEYSLTRADGLNPWLKALEDAVTGPASQFLLTDLAQEKNELTRACEAGSWQSNALGSMKKCLDTLGIDTPEIPVAANVGRWFALFATLRNKTRGHGATTTSKAATASALLTESLSTLYNNFSLFKRSWVYLYRNLSGKYRISIVANDSAPFDYLRARSEWHFPNGVYLFAASPRKVPLIASDADLTDFFFPNGAFAKRSYETLSYATDTRTRSDSSEYLLPPGALPGSETQGLGELEQLGRCFSNAPALAPDYVERAGLEGNITQLVADDRHPLITLLGRGGIGKTSLALRTLKGIASTSRFDVIIWFSARDVDLQPTGPKAVKPHVLSPESVSRFYVELVAPEKLSEVNFQPRQYFEHELARNELGPCLCVFDNFETTQNPIELYNWLDAHIRLPNKVLITTRLREFKGDYPIEVRGMTDEEARKLISTVSGNLGISQLLTPTYIAELIAHSEGHPYVMKILLGEVAKEQRPGSIPRLMAGRDEILTALFERTYASLRPCAQRAFMTLAAWNSPVSRIALEAVLYRSVDDMIEVERAVDTLLQFSLAESQRSTDEQEFISLPLVATLFGRKKLNVSTAQAAIKVDVELLQMLGPVHRGEIHFSLARQIETFLGNIARKVERGQSIEGYLPIFEIIGRRFPPTHLTLARWYMEEQEFSGYEKAKVELQRYLETDSTSPAAAEAWKQLAHCCFKTQDMLGDVNAFIQRAKIASVPFVDIASTAKLLNDLIRKNVLRIESDEKRVLGEELLGIMDRRQSEATADDFAQMAWLALRVNRFDSARSFVRKGLMLDPGNPHLENLASQPNISGGRE